jgi:hypothetical protein
MPPSARAEKLGRHRATLWQPKFKKFWRRAGCGEHTRCYSIPQDKTQRGGSDDMRHRKQDEVPTWMR